MENSIKHTYHVSGMTCGGCASSVKNRLSAAPGVSSVVVDLANKKAEITSSDLIKADKLQELLNGTQFNISEIN